MTLYTDGETPATDAEIEAEAGRIRKRRQKVERGGRKPVLSETHRKIALRWLDEGASVNHVATMMGVAWSTIKRLKDGGGVMGRCTCRFCEQSRDARAVKARGDVAEMSAFIDKVLDFYANESEEQSMRLAHLHDTMLGIAATLHTREPSDSLIADIKRALEALGLPAPAPAANASGQEGGGDESDR